MEQAEKKLYVVGIGPGDFEDMTVRAVRALRDCQVITGYTVYVELVREHFPGKEYRATGMTRETERCRMALEEAEQGKTVAMVCSGDSGVYGMAGLILQMAAGYPEVKVEIVAGVTAALSGGALLGAPLGHDFAVISLSDLLTPPELIERRLRSAAAGDFAICLYNPGSRNRSGYLRWACGILLSLRGKETVCGLVRRIGREGESVELTTLGELLDTPADMLTTVFVGSSRTERIGGRMVTPRGYRDV